MTSPFTVLILTEDKAGWDVVRTIVRKSFQEMDPAAIVWPEDRWARPAAKVARAARGSYWKSKSEHDQAERRELIREITTHLLRPAGFVAFHFDGDEPWSQRHQSENVAEWAHFCVLVAQNIQQRETDATIGERALSRLFAVTPFYCIESWLYVATDALLAACTAEHGAVHHEDIRKRSQALHGIEEQVQPWKLWCVGKSANERLAAQLPVAVAYGLGQSLHETLERMMACDELVRALKAARP